MSLYVNRKVLKLIGQRIEEQREKKKLDVSDVAYMTGFSDNTVRNVEAGKDTTVSYLVEVCIAVGLHPKDLFDMELEMKPRFELSPERKNKKKLTLRIREYIREGYFDTSRSAKDVVLKLEEDGIRTSSAVLSNILPRWLKTTKKGRRNSYRSK